MLWGRDRGGSRLEENRSAGWKELCSRSRTNNVTPVYQFEERGWLMSEIKVLLWGLGAMGSGMAEMLLAKENLRLVAVIDQDRDKVGRDLGSLTGSAPVGVRVTADPAQAFGCRPDLALVATASLVRDVFPHIKYALGKNADVITIAEEMAYPWAASEELSVEIDRLARKQGNTVLGTGINPGFILDTLIIALTGVCRGVRHIHGKRVNNLAPFGPTVMQTQGVGVAPGEFAAGLASGGIVGHVGFGQSVMLIGRALGWEIEEIVEEREPIISKVERQTKYVQVAPGEVAGCRHTARAYAGGKEVIFLEHPQQICPEAEGVGTGDYISIEGDPPLRLAIEPEIPGGSGTMAIAVNMIPLVINGPRGLVTMADLPVPRALPGLIGR